MPRSVFWMRALWCILHIAVPIYAAYVGYDAEAAGLPGQYEDYLMGIYWLPGVFLLFVQILTLDRLPRTPRRMGLLLLNPALTLLCERLLWPDLSVSEFLTACGMVYFVSVMIGFTVLAFFHPLMTRAWRKPDSERLGYLIGASAAQLVFLVPGWAVVYFFAALVWGSHFSRGLPVLDAPILNWVSMALYLISIAYDSEESFRGLKARSIYG